MIEEARGQLGSGTGSSRYGTNGRGKANRTGRRLAGAALGSLTCAVKALTMRFSVATMGVAVSRTAGGAGASKLESVSA